jgi:hypothetical protein
MFFHQGARPKEMLIDLRCVKCREMIYMRVYEKDWKVWTEVPRNQRPNIQEIFPYLNSAEREILISKVCGKCFDAMFPPEA